MDCNLVQDKLYEYIYNELDENTLLIIKSHIENCPGCEMEYMDLKKLLIEDIPKLISLKDTIKVPPELEFKVRSLIKPKLKFNFARYAVAACILLALVAATPALAYYIIQSTPLDKYVELQSGIIVDFEEGRGQLVQKSSTMQGITLTVDGIIPKKDRSTILFTIKAPKEGNINYGMPDLGHNVITVQDQFGISYRMQSSAITVKSVNEDGEAKCILDVSPIGFWAYKLNVRVTAIELGHYDTKMEKIKNVYGNWNVSFYVNKSDGKR